MISLKEVWDRVANKPLPPDVLPPEQFNTLMNMRYPCKECDNDELEIIPEAPHVAECSVCGHPNDTPTERQLQEYEASLMPAKVFMYLEVKNEKPARYWFHKRAKRYETIRFLSGRKYTKTFKEVALHLALELLKT